MIKILVSDKLAQEGLDLLKSNNDVQVDVKTGLPETELAGLVGEYEGLIVRSETKVTAKVLANSGKLKAIARAGAGVDNIDVPEATRKGILVLNTPGGNTLSVAEHTMALMLALSRNVVRACTSMKMGLWDKKKLMGKQLNNKVLGIVGLGRIGMAVAERARGFNMKILGYDPFAAPVDSEKLGIEVTDSLEIIFRESDYITIHVPKNEQTLNMIGSEQIKMMKPEVRLINCARGGIINEDALYEALAQKRIAGAALDVFSVEPPQDKRFAQFDNCVVTPHLGASTTEAQVDVAIEAVQILIDALRGGPVKNAVNAPTFDASVPPIVNLYVELARRIGRLVSAIAPGHIRNIGIQFRGLVADMPTKPISLGFAIGLLQQHFEIPLNMVNVSVLAKERGISIDETKNPEPKDVAASFSAKVVTDKVTRTVTGSVFGNKLLRILEIDDFNIEVSPQGTVLVIYNDDKPGVIGYVGTVCGKHKINIGTMGVGQKLTEGKAMLAVSLDREPDAKCIEELSGLEFVNELYVCKLD